MRLIAFSMAMLRSSNSLSLLGSQSRSKPDREPTRQPGGNT